MIGLLCCCVSGASHRGKLSVTCGLFTVACWVSRYLFVWCAISGNPLVFRVSYCSFTSLYITQMISDFGFYCDFWWDNTCLLVVLILPSVLWRCWLGGRKGIRPVKNFEWCSTGMVICLERDADLHIAQLMPLPLTVSCFSKIQIGFTFLVPAHPGSPGKKDR